MSSKTSNESVAFRDEAGCWYVLTSAVLMKARATAAQQAHLEQQAGDNTTEYGVIINEFFGSPLGQRSLTPPNLTLLQPTQQETHIDIS